MRCQLSGWLPPRGQAGQEAISCDRLRTSDRPEIDGSRRSLHGTTWSDPVGKSRPPELSEGNRQPTRLRFACENELRSKLSKQLWQVQDLNVEHITHIRYEYPVLPAMRPMSPSASRFSRDDSVAMSEGRRDKEGIGASLSIGEFGNGMISVALTYFALRPVDQLPNRLIAWSIVADRAGGEPIDSQPTIDPVVLSLDLLHNGPDEPDSVVLGRLLKPRPESGAE